MGKLVTEQQSFWATSASATEPQSKAGGQAGCGPNSIKRLRYGRGLIRADSRMHVPPISESHRQECLETMSIPGFPRALGRGGRGGSRPAYQISRLHRHPPVKTAQKPEPGGDGGSHWEPWAEPFRNILRTQKDFTRSLRSFFQRSS